MEKPNKNPAAVTLGRAGGLAGRGSVKSRGNRKYYSDLAKLSWEKRGISLGVQVISKTA